jgi:hypothetical protein
MTSKQMDSPSNQVGVALEIPAEQKQVSQEKELQFYAATVASWFETQLEFDRSLLTLSSAGIALLVTLLSTLGAQSKLLIGLYMAALLCFIVCMWSVLSIFKQNAAHLVELINNKATKDDVLAELDERAKYSFLLGVLFAAAIGIVSAFQPQRSQEGSMSKPDKPVLAQDSFNGASSLRPQELTKSFNGAAALRPAAPAATGGTTSGTGNSQSSTPQTTPQSSNSSAQKP